MTTREIEPLTAFDARYSEPGAEPTPWAEGRRVLETAELYRITTVRPDGRPHLTPLVAVWTAGAAHFCTGPQEQKGRNLAANPHVVLHTGSGALHAGLDVSVEGEAVRVLGGGDLRRIADAFLAKYGDEWHFRVEGDAFTHGPGSAHVFRIEPAAIRGFAKAPYGQTRWTFPD